MSISQSIFALLFVVTGPASTAAQQDTLFLRVQLMEGRGQVDSALAVLSQAAAQKLPVDTIHLRLLQRVSRALTNSGYYRDQGDIDLALDALQGLDLAGEPALRRVVEQKRSQLEANPTRQAQVRGMKEVGDAVGRVQHGNVDLAIVALEAIARDSTSRYPLSVRDSAMRSLRWARLQRARQDSGFVATFQRDMRVAGNSLSALLIYAAGLGVLATLIYVLRMIVGTRKGVGLELEDLTVPPGDARVDANRILVKDVSRLLRTTARSTTTSLGERAEDLDGVANLRADSPVQDALERLVQTGALQVGTVAIDPKQFISIIATLSQRPYRTTLRGQLGPSGETRRVLFVERFERQLRGGRFRRVRSARFYNRPGEDVDARESALQAFVTDYLFDSSVDKPTDVLDSFRDYCTALRLLEDSSSTDAHAQMDKVRRLLERAVCADQHNWAARFKLAELLRKAGNYAAAADHLQFVLEEIARPPCDQAPLLRAYLNRRPEMRLVLRYNLAVTRSLGFSTESHEHAIELLDGILHDLRPLPRTQTASPAARTAVVAGVLKVASAAKAAVISVATTTIAAKSVVISETTRVAGAAKAYWTRLRTVFQRIGKPATAAEPTTDVGVEQPAAAAAEPTAVAGATAAHRIPVGERMTVGHRGLVVLKSFLIPMSEIFPSRVSSAERKRIGLLALSAKASAIAAKMEGISESKGSACMDELKPLRAQVDAILGELESIKRTDISDPRTYYTALGITLNAAGRAAHLTRDLDVAIGYLERAINRVPDMPDPYVNLAATLIRKANGGRVPRRASEALTRALGINEANGKVHYYLARLAYANGRYKSADEHFTQADEHHWSLFLHAIVLARHLEPRNVELALSKLEQSIEGYPRPDQRYVFYLTLCAEELEKGVVLDPGTRRWASMLTLELEQSVDPSLQAAGTHFRWSRGFTEEWAHVESESELFAR